MIMLFIYCNFTHETTHEHTHIHTQVICSPPEDQRIPFKTLKGYWDYQLALDKCVKPDRLCTYILISLLIQYAYMS